MTLRVRLALALAALAAVAVLAVGVTTYATTVRALRIEVDQALAAYSRRVADPDGRFFDLLSCITDDEGVRVPDVVHNALRGVDERWLP